jgi:diadenosine tetraphosphate (Ap4A) HIT family hydrolase
MNMEKTSHTLRCFDKVMTSCGELFQQKLEDYGLSWGFLRWESLVDQMWIKAKRIRTLEEIGDANLIPEGRDAEYVGIINYSIIALMKLWYEKELPSAKEMLEKERVGDAAKEKVSDLFETVTNRIRELLTRKNHDYGEAWQEIDITSITDQILVKLARTKNILRQGRQLKVSEDLDAQFSDIVNYAVFALAKIEKYTGCIAENQLHEHCRFCEPPDKERILFQARNFYIMLSLGPIVQGYSLIIPYKHLSCYGMLCSESIEDFIALTGNLARILKKTHDTSSVVFFEHGRTAASIGLPPNDFHAHIHCVPVSKDTLLPMVEQIKSNLRISPISYPTFPDFCLDYRQNRLQEPYLYIEENRQVVVFYVSNKKLRSQYLRYVLATTLGIDQHLVDWMKHPSWETILRARRVLMPHLIPDARGEHGKS